MTRKSRREIERTVGKLESDTTTDHDLPPVFVEYGPDGEVETPGLFGVRSRDDGGGK